MKKEARQQAAAETPKNLPSDLTTKPSPGFDTQPNVITPPNPAQAGQELDSRGRQVGGLKKPA